MSRRAKYTPILWPIPTQCLAKKLIDLKCTNVMIACISNPISIPPQPVKKLTNGMSLLDNCSLFRLSGPPPFHTFVPLISYTKSSNVYPLVWSTAATGSPVFSARFNSFVIEPSLCSGESDIGKSKLCIVAPPKFAFIIPYSLLRNGSSGKSSESFSDSQMSKTMDGSMATRTDWNEIIE